MVLFLIHVGFAVLLFRLINWIGEHASDFGYASMTLFEEPRDSIAFNFFIRALAPAVFTVALAAAAVAFDHPHLRLGIYWIAIDYYVLRAIYIFAANLHRLVSWPRYVFHAGVGLAAVWAAYQFLILPNRSLLPNLDTVGNELWLAILAFLYAAANKATLSTAPGNRRRNAFVRRGYENAKRRYGSLIDTTIDDDSLKLITYAIIIYEDYCRPPAARSAERLMFWKHDRTTGIMQVASSRALTDGESVEQGTQMLRKSWQANEGAENYARTRATIADYNRDEDYLNKVSEVMRILATRVDVRHLPAFKSMWE